MGESVIFEDLRPGSTVIMKKDSLVSQQTWNLFCKDSSLKSENLDSLQMKQDMISQLAGQILLNKESAKMPCFFCEGSGLDSGIC